MQSIKRLLKKAHDEGKAEELALLEFRNTPITGLNESPAQLLMSRRLRSSLPMTDAMLQPSISKEVKRKLEQRQQRQKSFYDRGTRPLSSLQPNEVVRYQTGKMWKPAVVINKHPNLRSYNIQTPQGTVLRRNRRHLRPTKETFAPSDDTDDYCDDDLVINTPSDPQMPTNEPPTHDEPDQLTERRSRYGRLVRPPVRYPNN